MPETITIEVTDINDAPVIRALDTTLFVEHTRRTITVQATDEDASQTIRYALTGETHGATITVGGEFAWTPSEDDGGEVRTFTVTATDNGATPEVGTLEFTITATELANRNPTAAAIATVGGVTTITNPDTLEVSATAEDLDGETLTYAWSSSVTGDGDSGTFAPATGASTTWTPPDVTTATDVTLTVTVSDGAGGTDAIDSQIVAVNPDPDLPTFTYVSSSTNAFTVPENQARVGAVGHFVATSTASGTIAYSVDGTDSTLFTLSDGTLTFNDAPNFEAPTDDGGNKIYNLEVVATINSKPTSVPITVSVTNVNEAPTVVIDGGTPITVTNPTAFPAIIASVTDPDAGETFTYAWTSADSSGEIADTASGTFFSATSTSTANTIWTPPTITGADETITLTLTVTDDGGNIVTATHDVIVSAELATGFTVLATPVTVTESSTATDIEFTVALSGGTFPVDRIITVSPITGAGGGTATPVTDYTVASSTPLTITAGETSITVAIPLMALPDALDEGDGETVIFRSILLNATGDAPQDGFSTIDTSITIADPAAPSYTNSSSFTNIPVVENVDAVGADRVFHSNWFGHYSILAGWH